MKRDLDIRAQDLAIVRAILAAHLPADAAVWVFGSRARGSAKRAADLDLAVDAHRPLTRREAADLADAFEDSDLPYGVDIVDLRDAAAGIRAIVENDRIALIL